MITHASAYIPIRSPRLMCVRQLSAKGKEVYQEKLSIYLDQFASVIPMINDRISVEAVEIGMPSEDVVKTLNVDNKLLIPMIHDFLMVSVSYRNDVDKMCLENPQMEDRPVDELLYGCAAIALCNCVERIYLFSELAFPGLLDIYPGVVYEYGRPAIAIHRKQTFFFLFEDKFRETEVWPHISDLNLADVVSWSRKIGFGNDYFANSPLQRAVAGYGHVLSLGPFKEGECLFRIMQALEAFYTRGSGDLRTQLSEKIKLFLSGEKLETNLVGKLYDMRSKFVHGAALFDYPDDFRFKGEPGGKDDNKNCKRFSGSVDFGVRLLLASIQKCIRDSILEVNWKYAYSIETEHDF